MTAVYLPNRGALAQGRLWANEFGASGAVERDRKAVMSSGPTAAPVPPAAPVPDTETADAAAGRRREYVVILGSPVGIPQIIAGMLLTIFLAQCLWLAVHSPLREMELRRSRGAGAQCESATSTGSSVAPITAVSRDTSVSHRLVNSSS